MPQRRVAQAVVARSNHWTQSPSRECESDSGVSHLVVHGHDRHAKDLRVGARAYVRVCACACGLVRGGVAFLAGIRWWCLEGGWGQTSSLSISKKKLSPCASARGKIGVRGFLEWKGSIWASVTDAPLTARVQSDAALVRMRSAVQLDCIFYAGACGGPNL